MGNVRFNFIVLVLALALALNTAFVVAVSGNGHVPETICHKPGTPAQHELTVDNSAVLQAHLRHGDSLGPCVAITELTCVQAFAQGLLVGELDGEGHASVTNNANQSFPVSLAVYQMYASLIDDQTLFFSQTKNVSAGQTTVFNVSVPACGYQIDLVCGAPISEQAPYYSDRVIDFAFENQDEYCTLGDGSSGTGINATLSVDANYPQGTAYAFTCIASGFAPTRYDWYYGDGSILYDSVLSSVFHSYENDSYTAACRARDGVGHWAVDTFSVNN